MKTMHAFNLLYYTPKLWEKCVLFFCPLVANTNFPHNRLVQDLLKPAVYLWLHPGASGRR
jgi:hypothetical protein